MKFSRSAAVLAPLLMTLSWPHLKYSMEARGYGITIFLVLLVIFSAIQFLNNSRWVWGGVLIGSGFAMTMALPSNLFFLGSLTIFTIMDGWFESEKSRLNIKKLLWVIIPQLIMFALIAVYFLVIYEQLKYGKDIQPQSLDGKRIFEIGELLVAPWGFFMYLFFTIGAWRLRGARERIVFASIFFIQRV